MKTIGLIGGMSWESTLHYYQRINELVAARLGGLHSARLLLWSVEFAEIARLQHADDWEGAGRILADAARRLEHAGAEGLLICANTMHRVAPAVEAAVGVPVLHLADITARGLLADGHRSAALLGTRFTMAQPFYRERLERHGLSIRVLTPEEQDALHQIIFGELVKGRVEAASRERFITIMRRMHAAGAQAVILGCTEFGMLLRAEDAPDIPRRHHRTPLPGSRGLDARGRPRLQRRDLTDFQSRCCPPARTATPQRNHHERPRHAIRRACRHPPHADNSSESRL